MMSEELLLSLFDEDEEAECLLTLLEPEEGSGGSEGKGEGGEEGR